MVKRGGCAGSCVDIRFVKSWPAEDIIRLYEAGGWADGTEDAAFVKKVISGSFAFAVAVESEKAVGMGRVLSDGVSDAYIQEVVVLPECRRKELGKNLVAALRDRCLSRGIKWIALVAEPGTEDFYRNLGFRRMENYSPMRYVG